MFGMAVGFLNPFESWANDMLSKKLLISVCYLKAISITKRYPLVSFICLSDVNKESLQRM
jgi:hypothetical protein